MFYNNDCFRYSLFLSLRLFLSSFFSYFFVLFIPLFLFIRSFLLHLPLMLSISFHCSVFFLYLKPYFIHFHLIRVLSLNPWSPCGIFMVQKMAIASLCPRVLWVKNLSFSNLKFLYSPLPSQHSSEFLTFQSPW